MAEAIGKTGTAEDDARRVGALDEKEGALDGNEEALDGNREGRLSTRVQSGRGEGRKRHRSRTSCMGSTKTESKGLKEKHEPGRGWQKPLVKPEPQRTTRGELEHLTKKKEHSTETKKHWTETEKGG